LRFDVAFSSSFLAEAVRVSTNNWTSREPVFAAGEEDMPVCTATKQGPDGTSLPLNKLDIEICGGSPVSRQMEEKWP
jgi:hypothetical protein